LGLGARMGEQKMLMMGGVVVAATTLLVEMTGKNKFQMIATVWRTF
jgi:hypothetical protein